MCVLATDGRFWQRSCAYSYRGRLPDGGAARYSAVAFPFGRLRGVKTFDELFAELTARAAERPEGSGTVRLLDAGVHAIGKKLVEEAAEAWMAAEYESDEAAAEELSQLLYHVQVMMIARGLTLEDVGRYL